LQKDFSLSSTGSVSSHSRSLTRGFCPRAGLVIEAEPDAGLYSGADLGTGPGLEAEFVLEAELDSGTEVDLGADIGPGADPEAISVPEAELASGVRLDLGTDVGEEADPTVVLCLSVVLAISDEGFGGFLRLDTQGPMVLAFSAPFSFSVQRVEVDLIV